MTEMNSIPVLGDVGIEIIELQDRLRGLGYNPGSIDGIFGGQTRQAISALQKANGMPGSGVIGPKTLGLLGIKIVPVDPVNGSSPITKDLAGRKSRHIHPTLRLLIEKKLFPGRVVPREFSLKNLPQMVVMLAIALESLKVRETGGNNRGKLVGLIQGIIGPYLETGTGDAWCMSTVQVIVAFIEDFCGVESPVLDSESVTETGEAARKVPGLFTNECEVGTFFQAQYGSKWQGHSGTVLELLSGNQMRTFEGNTGSGSDRDGDGAFFKTRNRKNIGSSLIVRGFIRVYPNNVVPSTALKMSISDTASA